MEDDTWLLDYGGLLAAYRSVLGEDRVRPIDYEEAVAEHGSIIPALLEAAGLPPDQFPSAAEFWKNARKPPPSQLARVRRKLGKLRTHER